VHDIWVLILEELLTGKEARKTNKQTKKKLVRMRRKRSIGGKGRSKDPA
jgi:hypothetical protein